MWNTDLGKYMKATGILIAVISITFSSLAINDSLCCFLNKSQSLLHVLKLLLHILVAIVY